MNEKRVNDEALIEPKYLRKLAWFHTPSGNYLHYLGCWQDGDRLRPWDDAVDEGGVEASAICGRKARYVAPGIFSRMGLPRCGRCCSKLGIPDGIGAGVNDPALRKFAGRSA